MTITAIAALFIHQIPAIDIVHGFAPSIVFRSSPFPGVVAPLRGRLSHNIRMTGLDAGVYIGGLLIAGTFAFLPGRIMHALVFAAQLNPQLPRALYWR
jgi:uncharacterized membrane protein